MGIFHMLQHVEGSDNVGRTGGQPGRLQRGAPDVEARMPTLDMGYHLAGQIEPDHAMPGRRRREEELARSAAHLD